MENVRFVTASLNLVFDEGTIDDNAFMKEYYSLLIINDDPLGVWLKSAKIRKESETTDQVLLTLLTDLHRKVDSLMHKVSSNAPLHLPLRFEAVINAIGHGYVQMDEACLEEGKRYYGRIDMPTFPRRQVPIFFLAISPCCAKITLMHEDDEKDWSTYMVACERVIIRQMKGHSGEY